MQLNTLVDTLTKLSTNSIISNNSLKDYVEDAQPYYSSSLSYNILRSQTQFPRLQKWLSEQKHTDQFKFEHKTMTIVLN